MLKTKNLLLIKDDVGKAKPTCRDLPHKKHFYGKAETKDLEGAG